MPRQNGLGHLKKQAPLMRGFLLVCYHPIVYLEESGFKKDHYRLYAYAPKGQNCFERSNWNRRQTNVIGAQCCGIPFAFTAFECSIDSDVFHALVSEVLLSELSAHSFVLPLQSPLKIQ